MPETTDSREACLADPAVLATRTGLAADDATLLSELRGAAARLRGDVGHHITRVVDDVVELDATGGRVLWLPAAPVTDFAISINGRVLTLRTDYTLSRTMGMVKLQPHLTLPNELGAVEVTYTHGWDLDHIPADVSEAVLEAAEIQLNTERGLSARTVLGDTATFGGAAVGTTETWTRVVARLSR
jgi:hypothetical protein